MTIEEPEPNPTSDHILDWLEDSVTFLPSFLDDPYHAGGIDTYQWWTQGENLVQEQLISASDPSRKRRNADDPLPRSSQSQQQRKNHGRRINESEEGDEEIVTVKRSVGNKKTSNKSSGNNNTNGNNKDGRWAEQLLNPCAMAVTAGNLTRVQHLLYVLHELASPTGDANHRLAAHGLKALTYHLSSLSSSSSTSTFNRSFSHGVQWPTLLEPLTRRPGGPPPLVRLTIVAPSVENDQNTEIPFSVGPQGDNYTLQLLTFAKSMNINLQINRLDNHPLQNLNAQVIDLSPEETLIVCTQFRLHHLNHNTPDERTEFLRMIKSLEPKGVILSENNMDCSCSNCADFATGFARRVEYLWRFLDSTSTAFKGRESEERRVMEGEAAKALTNRGEMNEGKEKWCEKMKEVGFVGEVFGEDVIDGGKALLRKYDSNWEMRVDEKDGCVGLWWKAQPVSFCSLWKLEMKVNEIRSNI
ncbi:hypothetical protein Pint_29133 [Pistacia integerrima]|uniref:Uncharacterized protein n=1 Tax=Pistacia integerrima TaxID=434235 RepID=A0ACC0X1U8_9ROSI|nr:hypothetical protein Pint_29133 [Pistacia integerrima]